MSKFFNFYSCVIAIAIGLVVGEFISFWNFMADDAYILMRYATNLVTHGQWVYNINDYITAMTSPLHGFVEVILYFVTRELPVTNKVISVLAFVIIGVSGFRYFKGHKTSQLLFVVIFGTSPFVILWTVGGLETPYFSLVLFSMIYMCAKLMQEYTTKRMVLLAILSGLCFISRFDSIIFITCLIPFFLFKFGWKPFFTWGFIAAIIPVLWLGFSYVYFQDIFPTSYYEKHPKFSDRAFLIQNFDYITDFLVLSGLLLLTVVLLVWFVAKKSLRQKIILHFTTYGFAYVGLYFIFLYGLGTATVHMMFSFRMFVPYLPVLAFLFAEMVKQKEGENLPNYFSVSLSVFAVLLLASNMWLANYIKYTAINPSRNTWDYLKTSLNDYIISQDIIAESGELINKHWKTQPQSKTRGPRIITPAEGVVAYANPDAYVMGYLVSYRNYYHFFNALNSADYFGNASVIPNPMIANPEMDMKKLFDKSSPLYGLDCHWKIYFKEGVTVPNPIPNYINDTVRKKQ